jgi:hypothetical protein
LSDVAAITTAGKYDVTGLADELTALLRPRFTKTRVLFTEVTPDKSWYGEPMLRVIVVVDKAITGPDIRQISNAPLDVERALANRGFEYSLFSFVTKSDYDTEPDHDPAE